LIQNLKLNLPKKTSVQLYWRYFEWLTIELKVTGISFAVSVALVPGFGAYTTGVFRDLLFRLESEDPDRSSGWVCPPQLMKCPSPKAVYPKPFNVLKRTAKSK